MHGPAPHMLPPQLGGGSIGVGGVGGVGVVGGVTTGGRGAATTCVVSVYSEVFAWYGLTDTK